MSIKDRAMLCHLHLTCWTGERANARVAGEVTENKKAEAGSASVIVKLIPGAALKEIRSIDDRLRTSHNHFTLPWLDGGMRILPTENFLDHASALRGLMADRGKAVAHFEKLYPSLQKAAEARLGDLYDERQWPHVSEVGGQFRASVRHLPMPAGEDFRADMDPGDVERLREEIETTVRDQVHASMNAVRHRITASIQTFVDRIADYSVEVTPEGVKTRGVFRNTVLNELTRLAEVLPKLNLVNDPEIDQAAKDIQRMIVGHTPDMLRDDDALRAKVIADAKAIKKALG